MRVGDPVIFIEGPEKGKRGIVITSTVSSFLDRNNIKGPPLVRTEYTAELQCERSDGIGKLVQFFGFDIGKRVERMETEDDFEQISLFDVR